MKNMYTNYDTMSLIPMVVATFLKHNSSDDNHTLAPTSESSMSTVFRSPLVFVPHKPTPLLTLQNSCIDCTHIWKLITPSFDKRVSATYRCEDNIVRWERFIQPTLNRKTSIVISDTGRFKRQ